jgi:hypothetical protein
MPFSTWSLSKLAEFLVAEGVVEDISHEGLRALLREEGVSFQVIKTWKQSKDPDFEAKKNRVLHLYDIADGKTEPGTDDPTIVICMDEFGPLNLLPRPGKQWAPMAVKNEATSQDLSRRRRRRATYSRKNGVRHLLAAYDLTQDKLYGHVKVKKNHRLLGVLPLPADPPPARDPNGHRDGQLQSSPLDQEGPTSRRVGGRQQRRAGICAHKRQLAESDRGPVPGTPIFHAGGN